MSEQIVLDVQNLETTFHLKRGPFRAVANVSYQIKKGQTLGFVGERLVILEQISQSRHSITLGNPRLVHRRTN